jgi:chemotaxis regulatin CheY-phosphate phosphatase CheZ
MVTKKAPAKSSAPSNKLRSAPKTGIKKPVAPKPAAKARARNEAQASEVLSELKALAKELTKTAKGLNKKGSGNPKEVSSILGSVERMTAEAATKSLIEAESAKQVVVKLSESLSKDWSRKDIEAALKVVSGHLTNIIVAQEFQDLAGQSIRKAMKALVGAIIVTEGGGTTEEGRLSQIEIDSLLQDLIP